METVKVAGASAAKCGLACVAAVCGIALAGCCLQANPRTGSWHGHPSAWLEGFVFRVGGYSPKGCDLILCVELSAEDESASREVVRALETAPWLAAVRAVVVVRNGLTERPADEGAAGAGCAILESVDFVRGGRQPADVQSALLAALRRANDVTGVTPRILYVPGALREQDGNPISEERAELVRRIVLAANYGRVPIDVMPLHPEQLSWPQRLFLCRVACESGGRCLD